MLKKIKSVMAAVALAATMAIAPVSDVSADTIIIICDVDVCVIIIVR